MYSLALVAFRAPSCLYPPHNTFEVTTTPKEYKGKEHFIGTSQKINTLLSLNPHVNKRRRGYIEALDILRYHSFDFATSFLDSSAIISSLTILLKIFPDADFGIISVNRIPPLNCL